MNKPLQYIARIFGSRIFWNIFFWSLLLGTWFNAMNVKYQYLSAWYHLFTATFTLLMMVVCYVNNLYLLPRFLARRKYWQYALLFLPFAFFISFCITANFKLMQYYFPKINIGQVSYITTDVPPGYAFSDFMEGTINYFSFVVLWACGFSVAWYIRDYGRQVKLIEETQKKQVETELSFLKNQLNPHFLFNTMNNLYGLAMKKSDSAPDAILKLSSILRYLLYESNINEVSFEKEKEVMQAYIGLELLRLTNKDDFHFSINADRDYKIPPLLWLPVLENVFKHGTRYISENHHIEYDFKIENNTLRIFSKNEFKHINGTENGNKASGIGLVNLRKRLELLYRDKYIIHTNSDDNFYTTEILIKL